MSGPTRRDVLKAAVAAGGAAGLSACLDVGGESDAPQGPTDLTTLPERQYAWSEYVRQDEHGNEQLPRHQLLLYLTLTRDGAPTAADREQVAAAFDSLSRAYAWDHEGLLWSAAYSPAYFGRYDEPLHESVDCPPPHALSAFEQPEFDEQDVLVHLASDNPDVVLRAEQALLGERDGANGVQFEASLDGVAGFADESADRRTGFVGTGMPAERQENLEGIPEDGPVPDASPLFMGFAAGFTQNQATEDYVAISEGPFAEGTTKHVSNLRQRLEDWYGEQRFEERVMEMFSPKHATERWVEGVGTNLGDASRVDETLDDIEAQASEYGRVGHAQKAARANRDEEGNVRLLRRHFESTDDGVASLHFPSLQHRMSEFDAVRAAMNGADLTGVTPAVRQRVNNGILEYVFVVRRGNWVVPPRSRRALPRPR